MDWASPTSSFSSTAFVDTLVHVITVPLKHWWVLARLCLYSNCTQQSFTYSNLYSFSLYYLFWCCPDLLMLKSPRVFLVWYCCTSRRPSWPTSHRLFPALYCGDLFVLFYSLPYLLSFNHHFSPYLCSSHSGAQNFSPFLCLHYFNIVSASSFNPDPFFLAIALLPFLLLGPLTIVGSLPFDHHWFFVALVLLRFLRFHSLIVVSLWPFSHHHLIFFDSSSPLSIIGSPSPCYRQVLVVLILSSPVPHKCFFIALRRSVFLTRKMSVSFYQSPFLCWLFLCGSSFSSISLHNILIATLHCHSSVTTSSLRFLAFSLSPHPWLCIFLAIFFPLVYVDVLLLFLVAIPWCNFSIPFIVTIPLAYSRCPFYSPFLVAIFVSISRLYCLSPFIVHIFSPFYFSTPRHHFLSPFLVANFPYQFSESFFITISSCPISSLSLITSPFYNFCGGS